MKSYIQRLIPELWISKPVVIYKGPVPPNKFHLHRALQVVISPHNKITIDVGKNKKLSGNFIIIPPFARHEIGPTLQNCLVIFFEPNITIIEKYKFAEVSCLKLSEEEKKSIRLLIDQFTSKTFDILTFTKAKLQISDTDSSDSSCKDPRIAQVLSRIDNLDEIPPSAEALAKSVGISTSRFIHLFSEQTGMPFRSYYLWVKLRRALIQIQSGDDMTEAAHSSGFSDSSHFSRMFHSTFGFAPSLLKFMKISSSP